eukprot:12719540-Alexandrium_andersonii.AAC.1
MEASRSRTSGPISSSTVGHFEQVKPVPRVSCCRQPQSARTAIERHGMPRRPILAGHGQHGINV